MRNNLIQGAGIILLRENTEQKIEHLFLKNRLTSYWEPPKGEIESNEDFIYCALRELSEETGLVFEPKDILPIGPYCLSYNFGDKYKKIFLFAIHHLKNGERIELSEEHDSYIWESSSNLKNLIEENYIEILHDVHKDFSQINNIYYKQRKFQDGAIDFLKSLIKSYQLDDKMDWYLTGSTAAFENTFEKNQSNISDIDLVAITNGKQVNTNALSRIINKEISEELKTSCGVNFIHQTESINLNEHFWQYFKDNRIPVSKVKYELNFTDQKSEFNSDYNLFRVIWYTLLRTNFTSFFNQDYLYIKGIILLNYVGDTKRFNGYKKLLLDLHKKKNSGVKLSQNQLDLNDALKVKLNVEKINRDWMKIFVQHAESSLEFMKRDSTEFLLSKILLEVEAGNFLKLNSLITYLMKNIKQLAMYEKQFSKLPLNRENTWLILLIIRKLLWPQFFKFSGFKYDKYFQSFLERSNISNNLKKNIVHLYNKCL